MGPVRHSPDPPSQDGGSGEGYTLELISSSCFAQVDASQRLLWSPPRPQSSVGGRPELRGRGDVVLTHNRRDWSLLRMSDVGGRQATQAPPGEKETLGVVLRKSNTAPFSVPDSVRLGTLGIPGGRRDERGREGGPLSLSRLSSRPSCAPSKRRPRTWRRRLGRKQLAEPIALAESGRGSPPSCPRAVTRCAPATSRRNANARHAHTSADRGKHTRTPRRLETSGQRGGARRARRENTHSTPHPRAQQRYGCSGRCTWPSLPLQRKGGAAS